MTENDKLIKDRIHEIMEAIMKFGQGDFSVQIESSNKNDEIDSLAVGINMMIDDIRDAHETLKKSEESLRSILSSMDDLLFVLDKNGIFLDYYQSSGKTDFYIPLEHFLGKSYREVPLPPEVTKSFDIAINKVETTGMAQQVDYSLEMEGKKEWYSAKVSMRKNSSREFDGVTVVARNITRQKQIEEEILLANTILETQKETSIDGILVVDDQGKVVSYNKRFVEMWNVPDELVAAKDHTKLLPHTISLLENPGESIEKVEYLYAHREKKSRDEIVLMNGSVFDRYSAPLISATGDYFGRIWFFRDITQWKRMQEQLLRREKLAVLGQLAGGVGHELRNPLGVIKNSVYFLNMALESQDPELKETLNILEKEVATSERIINSLLDFARAKPPLRRKVDIQQILSQTLSRISVPENIKVEYPVVKSLPQVLADPDQLDQVFGNIILNGIQAMAEGGQLIIKWENQEPGWVAVSIADTGVGVPEENIEKIFEPLFTTKAKGIGLGMAISKTFVEGHGGSIDVQSEIGKGTTFTMKLPVLKKEDTCLHKPMEISEILDLTSETLKKKETNRERKNG